VIARPRNEKAAALGGCGHLRASHADRERVVDTLKTAFAPVVLAAAAAFAWLGGDGRSEPVAFVIAFAYFVFWLSTGADMLWQWHCASLPAAKPCVRCAHTAASHARERPAQPGRVH
jgi:hypothetical protein